MPLSVRSTGELREKLHVEILRAFLCKYNKWSRLNYPVNYKAIFIDVDHQPTSRNAYAPNKKMKTRIYGNLWKLHIWRHDFTLTNP